MKAGRQKVRLNNMLTKEDTSTFTQARQRRRSCLITLWPFSFFSCQSTLSTPLLFTFLILFSCDLLCPLCFLPALYFPMGSSFRSRHFCLSFSVSELQTAPASVQAARCPGRRGWAVSGVPLLACPWWHCLPSTHLPAFNECTEQ